MKKEHAAKTDATSIVAALPQVAAAMRVARVKRTDNRGLLPLNDARRFLGSVETFRKGKTKVIGVSRVFESDRVWAALLSLENAEEFVRYAKLLTWHFAGRGRDNTSALERYGSGILPWIESRLRDDSVLVNVPSCVVPCLLATRTSAALELALRATSVTDVPSLHDRLHDQPSGRSSTAKSRSIVDVDVDDDEDDEDQDEEEADEDQTADDSDDEEPTSDDLDKPDELDLARRWMTRHPTFYGHLATLAYCGQNRAEALLRDRAKVLGGAVREALEQTLGFAEAERYTEFFGLPRTRLPEELERLIAEAEAHDEPRGPVWTIAELDDAARRDEIPLWDSLTSTTAAMRVTGYASRHGDALVFEQIVYRPGSNSPVTWEMFAYGPGVAKRRASDDLVDPAADGLDNVEIGGGDFVDGMTNQIVLLGERDENGKPIAGSDTPRIVPSPFPMDDLSVHVRRALARKRGEEVRASARLPRSFVPTHEADRPRLRLVTPAEAFVVDLCRRHKRLLFATDRDLRNITGLPTGALRLFWFDSFEYFRGDQFPSSSKDLVLLVEALRARRKLTRLPGKANTRPESWIPQLAEARSYAAGDAWASDDDPFEFEASPKGPGITPYWSVMLSRGYPHGVWLLHEASLNKVGHAEQSMLHLVGEDQPVVRMFWPRRTACMWTRVCGMAEQKWATMDRGIATAMKIDRMLHAAEARRLVENFVLRSWNVPARVGAEVVLLLEALVGAAETVEAFTLALAKLSADAWEHARPALARAVFELGFVLRRTDGLVGAATNRLQALMPRGREGETIRMLDLVVHGRAGAQRSARSESEYAHVIDAPEWVCERLLDPQTAPSPPDVFLASLAGDEMLAKYEKRISKVAQATALGSQLSRLASARVVPMVLGLYGAHPDSRAVISQALFDRPNIRAELGSSIRGAHAKVAKALLSALDEMDERAEVRDLRQESLNAYADDDNDELDDEFDDDDDDD